ncbi:MAG: modification methylase [Candidatus Asgardarchaeum californiense]|nr:MAG: modification methylase [Candidatus Asgardarchaeum californiense]
MTQKNKNLHAAKRIKNDEFYTKIEDVEDELKHYKEHLKGKGIGCDCDDPSKSAFVKHLALKFDDYELEHVISTHYGPSQLSFMEPHQPSYMLKIIEEIKSVDELDKLERIPLKEGGDFRSEECIRLLKKMDIVVTNPPFSLFREYIARLIKYGKKFLIIGSMNAITYKEVFPLIKNNQIWLGRNSVNEFITPDGKIKKFGNIVWYTNLTHKKRNEELVLVKKYKGNKKEYPKYDNYDAINVNKIVDIPVDYDGVMGVPITFLNKHNPEQFEIIGLAAGNIRGLAGIPSSTGKDGPYVNGKLKYGRILIRRK